MDLVYVSGGEVAWKVLAFACFLSLKGIIQDIFCHVLIYLHADFFFPLDFKFQKGGRV